LFPGKANAATGLGEECRYQGDRACLFGHGHSGVFPQKEQHNEGHDRRLPDKVEHCPAWAILAMLVHNRFASKMIYVQHMGGRVDAKAGLTWL
jgi:hypothetical protein